MCPALSIFNMFHFPIYMTVLLQWWKISEYFILLSNCWVLDDFCGSSFDKGLGWQRVCVLHSHCLLLVLCDFSIHLFRPTFMVSFSKKKYSSILYWCGLCITSRRQCWKQTKEHAYLSICCQLTLSVPLTVGQLGMIHSIFACRIKRIESICLATGVNFSPFVPFQPFPVGCPKTTI